MWHLTAPGPAVIDEYTKVLEGKLYDTIMKYKGGMKMTLSRVLLPQNRKDVIHRLLTEPPLYAYDLNNLLMRELMKSKKKAYNVTELPNFQRIKRMKSKSRKKADKEIFTKYNRILKVLGEVFKYDAWISGNADFSYQLSQWKGAKTCTYCGREYIYTVEDLTPEYKIKHIARPDFDHFLSKELFPLLSLNYYNLIPCCPICNRTVKGTQVFNLDDYVHPYLQSGDPKFRFSFRYTDYKKIHGEVIVVDDNDPKEKNTLDAFQLRRSTNLIVRLSWMTCSG